MNLNDRVALVTGAGTGIGRGAAEAFARDGATVVVNYRRSREAADEVVASILARGGTALAVQADVSRESDVLAMIERIDHEFGRLDYLVNNAGWSTRVPHGQFHDLTEEIWERTLNTNLRGPFYCVRCALSLLKRQPGSSIVNVASVAGLRGMGSSMIYAASKGALLTMTKSLARALAPDIRVNAVAPGLVRTRFADWPAETFDQTEKITPLRRLPTVEELGTVIVFFAAYATAVTGETMVVDGGTHQLGRL